MARPEPEDQFKQAVESQFWNESQGFQLLDRPANSNYIQCYIIYLTSNRSKRRGLLIWPEAAGFKPFLGRDSSPPTPQLQTSLKSYQNTEFRKAPSPQEQNLIRIFHILRFPVPYSDPVPLGLGAGELSCMDKLIDQNSLRWVPIVITLRINLSWNRSEVKLVLKDRQTVNASWD